MGFGPKSRAAFGAAVIVASVVAAYAPAFRAGFVSDDHMLVEGSRVVGGPLSAIWAGAGTLDYWPLTYTAYWVEWRLFGPNPFGYHVVGIALHALCALLLWRVLSRLEVRGAWLAGLLFALHPVAVESVAWISEQKNTLSGVLWCATGLAWLRYDEARSARRLALVLGVYGLALLAKVSVVGFPFVLLGIALARRGRLERRDVIDAAPFAALAIAAASVNVWFQQHRGVLAGGWSHRGFAERLGGAGWALAAYLESAFVPVRLAVIHPPFRVSPETLLFWVPFAGLGAAFAVLWSLRARWTRPVLLSLGYHALCVAPVLGFVDIAFFAVAPVSNHLQYLALMGPVALVAWALTGVARWRPAVANAVAAGVVLAFAATTFHRSTAFHDDLSLWRAAVAEAPDSIWARQSLASELLDRGLAEEAAAEFEAVATLSREPGVQQWARLHYLVLTRPAEAADEAYRLLAISDAPDLRSEAAWALIQVGRPGDAVAPLADLVRRAPNGSEYVFRLSVALTRSGRMGEAADLLLAYCRAQPNDRRMESALALLLVKLGRRQQARAYAAQVLGVDPSDPRADGQVEAWYSEAMGGSGHR